MTTCAPHPSAALAEAETLERLYELLALGSPTRTQPRKTSCCSSATSR
jgi:hypothetical protein